MFSLFNFSSIFPGGQLTPFAPMCAKAHVYDWALKQRHENCTREQQLSSFPREFSFKRSLRTKRSLAGGVDERAGVECLDRSDKLRHTGVDLQSSNLHPGRSRRSSVEPSQWSNSGVGRMGKVPRVQGTPTSRPRRLIKIIFALSEN